MTLRSSIQELTETHLKMGPAGKPVQAPSLLSELRAAVKPGNDGGVYRLGFNTKVNP